MCCKKGIIWGIVIVLILAAGVWILKTKVLVRYDQENDQPASQTEQAAQQQDIQKKAETSLLVAVFQLGLNLLGSWRQEHPESSVCPNDAYEIRFAVDAKGKLNFDSWLHCKAYESGTWELKQGEIVITVGDEKITEKIIVSAEALSLGSRGDFKRVMDEFSEVGALMSFWHKFFAPSLLSFEEAKAIAEIDCKKDGKLAGGWFYNLNTKTWWFETDIEKQGCAPACVVSEETKKAEINWRCTGLITP
jgi:hypothetical protein